MYDFIFGLKKFRIKENFCRKIPACQIDKKKRTISKILPPLYISYKRKSPMAGF
jgi:hypothetical protein